MADFVLRGPPRLRFSVAASIAGQIGTGAVINLAAAATARAVGAGTLLRGVNLAGAGVASASSTAALLKGIRLSGSAAAGAAVTGAITVSNTPPLGLSYDYNGNEGNAIQQAAGPMKWQTIFTTIDGKIIAWGTGDHGHSQDNSVREYDPVTQTETAVRAADTYGYPLYIANPGGPAFPFGARPESQHDNFFYWYSPRLDTLMIPGRGAYHRPSGQWTHANRLEVRSSDGTWGGTVTGPYGDGDVSTFPGDAGAPLGWAAGTTGVRVISTNAASLIYPGVGIAPVDDLGTEHYNPHSAWSKQFDCGVRIGGAPSGGSGSPPMQYLMVVARSENFGSYAQPYYLYKRDLPATVGGVSPCTHEGRDGCCFVGPYVYWVGGAHPTGGSGGTLRPWFFRMDIRPHLTSTAATVTIDRLQDAPFSFSMGLLRHDPFTGVLLLVTDLGVARFDLATSSWSDITPAAYIADYDANDLPDSTMGDFVDYRGSTRKRRFYWRPGVCDNNSPTNVRQTRFRSIGFNRVIDVRYLNITAANPENPAADFGSDGAMFRSCKHIGLKVNGTGANRKLYLISGDWTDCYPSNTNATSGYKPEGTYGDSGRQEIWMAPIGTSEIASGSVRFSMVSNAYAKYPWTGTQGYYNSAQKGPQGADGFPVCVDKRGQFWVGPVDDPDYVIGLPEINGNSTTYAAMYQWTQPGTNNTAVTGAGINGVALGNGWTLPSQDRLRKPAGGTAGTDYDISSSGASDGHGWGRLNAQGAIYDATNDRIYTVSVGLNAAAKQFSIQLYAFNPDPAAAASNGGKYAWTKLALVTKNLRDFGGPPDAWYTGLNMGGWGDNNRGTINCSAQMIGRRLYFVALWGYEPASGSPLPARRPSVSGKFTQAHLFSIDVDNPTGTDGLEWIPFPESQNWWCRVWDGPDSVMGDYGTDFVPGGASGVTLTPAQQRSLCCISDKLVLGPDNWLKTGVDPWIQIYDTTRRVWISSQPASENDWPVSLFSFVAVPDLGEAWLLGNYNVSAYPDDVGFLTALGLHNPPANAGRRIVRFKVT